MVTNLAFWRIVLWSDETKMLMFGHNDHRYVCREKGEADREAQGRRHRVVGVLCCKRDWCTIKIDGTMKRENYVDILKQHLKTSAGKLKVGCTLVFQMEYNSKQTSEDMTKWPKDNKVKVLEWPSQTIDVNPIESLHSELK